MRQLLYIFFLIAAVPALAQDMHFSHFYAAPLNLNPALTGNFDGKYRIGGNYKNQWQSVTVPYRTFSGYADVKLWSNTRTPFVNGNFGAGIYILNDRAGDGNLTTNKVFGSLAYHQRINEWQFSLGAGIGYVQKSLDFSRLVFDQQWTSNGFDMELPTGELMNEQSLNYIDLQTGISVKYALSDEENIYIGGNIAHIIQPVESFYNDNNRLGMRPVIHGGAYIKLQEYLFLEPGIVYVNQRKASEFLMGANAGLDLEKETYTALLAGIWYRGSGDAIPVIGMDYDKLRVLLSYDINFGKLVPASENRRGIEVSVVYIGDVNKDPYIRQIPCIRY